MKRTLIALIGAALLLTPLGGAQAQPGTQTCTETQVVVARAQADVDALNADLAVQVAALAEARRLLEVAVESAKPFFRAEITRLEGVVAALRVRLGTAQAQLVVVIGQRDTACTVPPTTTTPPTTSQPPTTTPSATPLPGLDHEDGDFDQVGRAPSGGVGTGG